MREELLRTLTGLAGPAGEEAAVLGWPQTECGGRGELKWRVRLRLAFPTTEPSSGGDR